MSDKVLIIPAAELAKRQLDKQKQNHISSQQWVSKVLPEMIEFINSRLQQMPFYQDTMTVSLDFFESVQEALQEEGYLHRMSLLKISLKCLLSNYGYEVTERNNDLQISWAHHFLKE